MQGAFKIVNHLRAMPEVISQEGLFTLAKTGDIEQLTTNNNIYFQKLWLYPGKAVASGKLTANAAAIYCGKTGPAFSFTPGQLTAVGPTVQVTAPAHGLPEGASIAVSGVTPAAYNIALVRISEVTPNSFSYVVPTAPTGPATVLGTIARVQYLPDVLNPNDLPIKFELPLGQKMRLSQIIVTGNAGDGVFFQFS